MYAKLRISKFINRCPIKRTFQSFASRLNENCLMQPNYNILSFIKDPSEAEIPYRFAEEEVAVTRSLPINKSADFMNTCKSEDSCQKLLDLLDLVHHYLIVCDTLPSHAKQPIREEAAETPSILSEGYDHDD